MQSKSSNASPTGDSQPVKHPTFALATLAIGSLGIGTNEFGPSGMLLNIANGVEVSVPSAGLLISAYAIGVTITAPLTTLYFQRWGKRNALMALMAIFTLGNLLSAFAPGYLTLMAARVVASLCQGGFFGIGAVVAASLVPRHKQASAVATMFAGLTIANIGGVPLATWISDTFGWREAFAAISLLGLVAMLSIRAAIPADSKSNEAPTSVMTELRTVMQPAILLGFLTTVLNAGAMFAMYTYINPALQEFAGAAPALVTLYLSLAGVGFLVGNYVGGKLSDFSIHKTLITFLLLEVFCMLAFPSIAQSKVGAGIGLFVWAIATFALVPPVQMQVMRAAKGAEGLASSINISAFNLGNAIGAAAGAMVLSHGLGYAEVMYAGALLAAGGLVISVFLSQRRPLQAMSASQSA